METQWQEKDCQKHATCRAIANRLEAKGYGDSAKVIAKETRRRRGQNRRVDFFIVAPARQPPFLAGQEGVREWAGGSARMGRPDKV